MLKHLIMILFFAALADGALLAEEKQPSGDASAPRKRGRPALSFDLSAAGFSGDSAGDYRAVLDNRLFAIGESLPVYNTLKAERRSTKTEGVPSNLYSVSDTVMAMSDDILAFGMIGSPSDKPFHSSDEITIMGAASRTVWESGAHSLSAAVFISNTRYWGWYIPIPFISYRYKDDTVTANIGVPTLIFWKISRDLTYSFSYFPVMRFETALAWRPLPFITVGPELAFIQDKYYIADRAHKDENLYRRYVSAAIGVQSYITSFAGLYLKAGFLPYNDYVRGTSSMTSNRPIDSGMEFFVIGGLRLFLF
jgi:hypothetical protein